MRKYLFLFFNGFICVVLRMFFLLVRYLYYFIFFLFILLLYIFVEILFILVLVKKEDDFDILLEGYDFFVYLLSLSFDINVNGICILDIIGEEEVGDWLFMFVIVYFC